MTKINDKAEAKLVQIFQMAFGRTANNRNLPGISKDPIAAAILELGVELNYLTINEEGDYDYVSTQSSWYSDNNGPLSPSNSKWIDVRENEFRKAISAISAIKAEHDAAMNEALQELEDDMGGYRLNA